MAFNAWVEMSGRDRREILIGLVGYTFGKEPETRLDEIRGSRRAFAGLIADATQIQPTDIVMDLGSGCGFGTYEFAKRAKHVHACDVSPSYLQFAKDECRDVENITFHQIEPRSLSPIPDASIDVVCAMSVFIHFNLYDIYWTFRELERVTRPGARVWIDIADAGAVDLANPNAAATKFFIDHANAYKAQPEGVSGLMQWNSLDSVVAIASQFGFRSVDRAAGTSMLFCKSPNPPEATARRSRAAWPWRRRSRSS